MHNETWKKNWKSFVLLYRLYRVITCCFQNKYLPKLLSIIHKTNGFIAKLDFPFSKKKWINEANRSRSLSNRYYQAKFHLISRVWIIEIDLISFSDLQNGPFLILRGRSVFVGGIQSQQDSVYLAPSNCFRIFLRLRYQKRMTSLSIRKDWVVLFQFLIFQFWLRSN